MNAVPAERTVKATATAAIAWKCGQMPGPSTNMPREERIVCFFFVAFTTQWQPFASPFCASCCFCLRPPATSHGCHGNAMFARSACVKNKIYRKTYGYRTLIHTDNDRTHTPTHTRARTMDGKKSQERAPVRDREKKRERLVNECAPSWSTGGNTERERFCWHSSMFCWLCVVMAL